MADLGVDLSNFAYNANVYPIDNVIINETNVHDLKKGDELWLYVIGNRPFDVDFDCDRIADVNTEESGLKLRAGKDIRHRFGVNWCNGIAFEIEAESYKPDAPGVIEITGCKISGAVYPDVEYNVVVSGNAVARNDQYVFEDEWDSSYDVVKRNQWWLFDVAPYPQLAMQLTENEFDTIQQAPPAEIDIPSVYKPTAKSRAYNEYTPASDETAGVKPFILREVAPGYKLGLISMRTFAKFIEGDEPDWNAETSTATITGFDVNGNALEVKLVTGDTKGTINGVSWDIAEFSGSAPSGTCTALNENGIIYLPLRFLCNAAGCGCDWNPITYTATLTIY
jgi:hypothetical protein